MTVNSLVGRPLPVERVSSCRRMERPRLPIARTSPPASESPADARPEERVSEDPSSVRVTTGRGEVNPICGAMTQLTVTVFEREAASAGEAPTAVKLRMNVRAHTILRIERSQNKSPFSLDRRKMGLLTEPFTGHGSPTTLSPQGVRFAALRPLLSEGLPFRRSFSMNVPSRTIPDAQDHYKSLKIDYSCNYIFNNKIELLNIFNN